MEFPEELQGKPTLSVVWREDTQEPVLIFDPAEFRSFPFVIHCLEQAARTVKDNWDSAKRMQAQQQLMQNAQSAAIAQAVMGKRNGLPPR
jgi:hypothetical protein